jgi:hypothetical protein
MRIIPIMPKVKMMAGIAAISGKFGNMFCGDYRLKK